MERTRGGGTRRAKQRGPLDENGLFAYAVASLARRMRSVRDLRRLMRTRAEPGEAGEQAMDAVVRRLEELRYLSDERFAADYARLRKEGQALGRRRVARDLAAKGVATPLVTEALEQTYGETDELELARAFCDRKRIRPPEDERAAARVMGRLVRAGFGTAAIWKLFREWRTPVNETAAESLGDDDIATD